jgi:hypothetical protein
MKSIVRAAFVATLLCSAASVVAPAYAADAPKLTREVQKDLAAVQTALKTSDYAAALASIKAAQAVDGRTPYDDFMINTFLASIYIQQKDYTSATAPLEAAADSPAIPDDQKKQTYFNAFQLAMNAKDFQKATVYGQQLQAMNALDSRMQANLALAFYEIKDMAHAQQFAQMSVDADKAAGRTPDENALKIIENSQISQKDTGAVQATLENLALNYNHADTWNKLIDVALGTKGIRELDELYLFRLKYQIPETMTPDDYLALGSVANSMGYATEAYNVLQKGISSGKITVAKAGPTYTQAKTGAGIDERSLASIAASAQKAKTGEQDIKLAEDYWGYGRFADAEVAARRAISKGGIKDPSEGPMLLGMLLTVQGKYDEAIQTFSQVSGSASRTADAHIWNLYAQAQKHAQSGAAPVAAPAH